jgi:hypothetical protein
MIVNVGLVETVDLAELSCQSEDVLESSQMSFSLESFSFRLQRRMINNVILLRLTSKGHFQVNLMAAEMYRNLSQRKSDSA